MFAGTASSPQGARTVRLLLNLYTWARRGALGNPGWQDAATSREFTALRGPLADRALEVMTGERSYGPLQLHGHSRSRDYYPDVAVYSPVEEGGIFVFQYWLGYDGATGRTDQYRVWSFVVESWQQASHTPGQILAGIFSFHRMLEEQVEEREVAPIAPPAVPDDDWSTVAEVPAAALTQALDVLLDAPDPKFGRVVLNSVDPKVTLRFWRAICALLPARLRSFVSLATGAQLPLVTRRHIVGLLPGLSVSEGDGPAEVTIIEPAASADSYCPRHPYVRWLMLEAGFDKQRLDRLFQLFDRLSGNGSLGEGTALLDRIAWIYLDLAALAHGEPLDWQDLDSRIADFGEGQTRFWWREFHAASASFLQGPADRHEKLAAVLNVLRLTGAPPDGAHALVVEIADGLPQGDDPATRLLAAHCSQAHPSEDLVLNWLIETCSQWTREELSAWFARFTESQAHLDFLRKVAGLIARRQESDSLQKVLLALWKAGREAEAKPGALLGETTDAVISASDESRLAQLPDDQREMLLEWLARVPATTSSVRTLARTYHDSSNLLRLVPSLLADSRPSALGAILAFGVDGVSDLSREELGKHLEDIAEAILGVPDARRFLALWSKLSESLARLYAELEEPFERASPLLRRLISEEAKLPLQSFVTAVSKALRRPPEIWYTPPAAWLLESEHDVNLAEDLEDELGDRASLLVHAFLSSEHYRRSLHGALKESGSLEVLLSQRRKKLLGNKVTPLLTWWWHKLTKTDASMRIDRASRILKFLPAEGAAEIEVEMLRFLVPQLARQRGALRKDSAVLAAFTKLCMRDEIDLNNHVKEIHLDSCLSALKKLRIAPEAGSVYVKLARAVARRDEESRDRVESLLLAGDVGESDLSDTRSLMSLVAEERRMSYARKIYVLARSHGEEEFKDTVMQISESISPAGTFEKDVLYERLMRKRGRQTLLEEREKYLYQRLLALETPTEDTIQMKLDLALLVMDSTASEDDIELCLAAFDSASLNEISGWVERIFKEAPAAHQRQWPTSRQRALSLLLRCVTALWHLQPQPEQSILKLLRVAIDADDAQYNSSSDPIDLPSDVVEEFLTAAFAKGQDQMEQFLKLLRCDDEAVARSKSAIIVSLRRKLTEGDSTMVNHALEELVAIGFPYAGHFLDGVLRSDHMLGRRWQPPLSLLQPDTRTGVIPLIEISKETLHRDLKNILQSKLKNDDVINQLAVPFYAYLDRNSDFSTLRDTLQNTPSGLSLMIVARLIRRARERMVELETKQDAWNALARAVEGFALDEADCITARETMETCAACSVDTGEDIVAAMERIVLAVLKVWPRQQELCPGHTLRSFLLHAVTRARRSKRVDQQRLFPEYLTYLGHCPDLGLLLDEIVEEKVPFIDPDIERAAYEALHECPGGKQRALRYRRMLISRALGRKGGDLTFLYTLYPKGCMSLPAVVAETVAELIRKGVAEPKRLAKSICDLLSLTAEARQRILAGEILHSLRGRQDHGSPEEHKRSEEAIRMTRAMLEFEQEKLAPMFNEEPPDDAREKS